jgi:aminoglycoside N3'-acetyltransferase
MASVEAGGAMQGKREVLEQLRAIGLRAGDLAMVHTSLRAIGPLAGGPTTLLDALLECLTPEGTLAAYVSWQQSSYDATVDGRPLTREERDAWPVFDPDTAAPYDGFGQFNRFICGHPDVRRSAHPDASIAAIGRRAVELTADHALVDGYGPASPLGRLVQWRGRVLMLGAPPGSVTALHLAEAIARIPGKRRVRYQVPVRVDGERCWREAEEFDTNALLDACIETGFDPIEAIATDYVAEGNGVRGRLGDANCWLFDAHDLVQFGARWLENRFAVTAPPRTTSAGA